MGNVLIMRIFRFFLFALDQTIVATALPRIVSQFNALSSIAWVASAYFLTQVCQRQLLVSSKRILTFLPARLTRNKAGLILFFGGVLSIVPTKWVFISTVALFELGSLVCGVAPSINVLIFGRALAGIGASGIFSSCVTIIAEICPLEKRPVLLGSFGGVFAIASVCFLDFIEF